MEVDMPLGGIGLEIGGGVTKLKCHLLPLDR